MINISRSENVVTLTMESGLSSVPNIMFEYKCSSVMCAEMLARRLQDRLWNRVESIRENEYNTGYKAGRSKVAKRTFFYSSLDHKSY